MSEPIIFLDIDGVLNNHAVHPITKYGSIDRDKAELFNEILERTGAKFVVTSSWRYLVHSYSMNWRGLQNLLYTHWIRADRYRDYTRPDDGNETDRAKQVTEWLALRPECHGVPYVVIDDIDFRFDVAGHPFVKIDGDTGITREDAEKVIAILMGGVSK